MHSKTIALILAIGASALGYKNNCEGSSNSPDSNDCYAALDSINVAETYNNQDQFSTGNCFVVYATNGAGDQPIQGQIIKDTVNDILQECGDHKGSRGTNNCDGCHVTVNYRSSV